MINLFKNLKARKNNDDKDAYDEFIRIYHKKESDDSGKIICFNGKYFTRKNIRVIILEQNGSQNSVAYDSQSTSLKDISSPSTQTGGFFNVTSNKNVFDTVFGSSGVLPPDSNQQAKIHMLRPDNQILFTLVYASYSQILKKIRSLSHSPSLSRSSSLGDYASFNNLVLNDLGNHQLQKRVAICVTWSCNLEDESAVKLFFHFFVHFMSLISGLAERIAQIHQDNGSFCSEKMTKARHWFTDSLRSLFLPPRLILPIWLTFSAIERYSWLSETGNCRSMKRVFLEKCVSHLLQKYHTKEKNFFLARILTAVLIYHQGWINSVAPEVYHRHKRLFSCQPGICRFTKTSTNDVCNQLGSLLLGCGGLSLSRTVVMGSNHAQVSLILYFISYWLRSILLNMKDSEFVDFSKQPDSKKQTSTRRKSASCNDPSDSGIASQEDLRRLLSSRGESRGSNCSSIHTIGLRNGSISTTQYKSSASTGSSPVKDPGERTFKEFFTRDQIISVDQAATEFFYNQRLQPKSTDTRKPSFEKESNSPIIQESKIRVVDVPLVYGREPKVDDHILYRSLSHFNIVGYADHIVPVVALHGTSDISLPNVAFSEEMKQWLRHAFWMYPSQWKTDFDWNIESISAESFTDRPTTATSILLNADKGLVTICSVTNDNCDNDFHQKELLSPSHIILSMLDQLQALLTIAAEPSIVLQFLETSLANIYNLSISLATFIRQIKHLDSTISSSHIDKHLLAQATMCHEDDIPLLYSTALAHSPDICGLETILLH